VGGAVRGAGVLDLRTASVSVHRADPGVRADVDAANVGGGQGGHGVRSLHDRRACGVVPRAVDVLHVHRSVRRRPGGDGWVVWVLAAGLVSMAAIRVPRVDGVWDTQKSASTLAP